MTQYKNTLIRLALLLAALLTAPLGAAEQRNYEIELLVFQNLIENDGGEIWPIDYSEWYEEARREKQQQDGAPLAVTWLPQSRHRLKAQQGALGRSANYRPLAYYAWRQAVPDRNQARSVRLPASTPNRGAYVDGSAEVALGRYLHLTLDLQMHSSAASGAISLRDDMLELEIPEFRLREQRRMRSREIHYFDHPRFGVIALITPYQSQPATQAAPAEKSAAP